MEYSYLAQERASTLKYLERIPGWDDAWLSVT